MTSVKIVATLGDTTYTSAVVSAQEFLDYNVHGMYIVRIEYPSQQFNQAAGGILIQPEGALCAISVGGSAQVDTWYGYVHHHTVLSEPTATTVEVEYVLLGTSRSMDYLADRRWTNTSTSAVVRDVVASRGFRSVISRSGLILPYAATGALTDFQLLLDMADKTGYRIACRNATFHFSDPRHRIMGNDTGRVFPFGQQKSPTSNDSIYSFKILSGTDLPDNQNRQSIYSGVNRETRSVVTATGASNGRATVRKTGYVDSIAHARQAALADDLKSRFWTHAQIVVDGSSTMELGDLVDLSGGAVPPVYQGVWAICSVDRRYTRGVDRMVTTLTLERNQPSALTYEKTITLPNRNSNDFIMIRDGKWVAKIREDFTVG